MKIDVLVGEIGSTTTVVNGFSFIGGADFVGQGQAPTTVSSDVNEGLKNAIKDLENKIGEKIEYDELLATSSAAGGLKMSVHGLVHEMTVKASKEACLGAGGIIKNITSGKLRRLDVEKVKNLDINIILIAGGVDYGERDTAIENFEKLIKVRKDVPYIYAGNVQNQEEIKLIAKEEGVEVYIVENVYPEIDVLNVEPTRKVIQDVFEEHIIKSKGMEKLKEMVTGKIMPTPGAVMESTKLLSEYIGDLIVYDVGGATTDLHSVTKGSEEISEIQSTPEPVAKRTVEGDLGVYVNMENIVMGIGIEEVEKQFKNVKELLKNVGAIPEGDEEIRFIEYLTEVAIKKACNRHGGSLVEYFTSTGKKLVAKGKDLTAVKYIVGTGGALTRLPNRVSIMESTVENKNSMKLLPREGVKILVDNDYIMASLGVLSKKYRKEALELMIKSLKI